MMTKGANCGMISLLDHAAKHCTLDSFATLMNMDGYLLLSNDPF